MDLNHSTSTDNDINQSTSYDLNLCDSNDFSFYDDYSDTSSRYTNGEIKPRKGY